MIEKSDLSFLIPGIVALIALLSANDVNVKIIGAMSLIGIIIVYITSAQFKKINLEIEEKFNKHIRIYHKKENEPNRKNKE